MDTEAMDTTSPASGSFSIQSVLLDEFQSWQSATEKKLNLKEVVQDPEDNKVSLRFALDSSGTQKFILHCPTHYPKYSIDEDNFFVEADSGLQLWCNALNEYLLDTDSRLTLSAILTKGLSLYTSADEAAANSSRRGSFNHPKGGCNGSDFDEDANHCQGDDDEDNIADDDEEDDMDVNDEEEEEDQLPGDDEQLEYILDNDLTWELEIARRKKRWKIKEAELRADRSNKNSDAAAAEKDKTLQQLYHDPTMKNRQPKQVFTSAAASGILTNDLVQIMETVNHTGIEADTIEDNIFQWNVRIKNFGEGKLDADFKELKAKFDYDYIELQLDFSMDLYPFFPPLVKVIRPRLQGSMMLRVTTMEILKLSYWNPARDMKSVLVDIKSFLQTWARLDLQSERNDRNRYPEGAYIDIEHHLLRLALVSEIVPRANKKYVSQAAPAPTVVPVPEDPDKPSTSQGLGEKKKSEEKRSTKTSRFVLFGSKESADLKEQKKKSRLAKNMAKGVGYSSYQQKGWDVKAYMAAQKEKDKQIELVLEKIQQELKRLHGSQQPASKATNDQSEPNSNNPTNNSELPVVDVDSKVSSSENHCRGGSRRKRKHSPDDVSNDLVAGGASGCPVDLQSDLYAVLEGSALIPFLESKLQANSFLEICSHANVYKCVINIVKEIASQPCLVALLGPLPDQAQSIQALLLALGNLAKVMLEKIGKASANGSVPKSGKAEKVTEKSSDDKLARDYLAISKEVTQALVKSGVIANGNGESPEDTPVEESPTSTTAVVVQEHNKVDSPEPGPSQMETCSSSPQPGPSGLNLKKSREEKSAELYRKHMKSLQLDTVDISLQGPQAHAYAASYIKAGSPSSRVIIRVAQEVTGLATSLPLDFSSAIFLRSDDDKATLLRAIITGPEETPYTGGCYQFDIYFPSQYPRVPPMVNFRTTGGGLVRFNPNLYNCGKVCLSLLGTWEGAQGEQWNETSTILQVLISIQSLILCSEPYYNEPGFDRIYGTTQGDLESLRYSENVFRNNLRYAILGQLQNPPEGFEEVIKAHFFLKRHILLAELEKMLEKYKGKDIRKQFAEVKKELMKLEQPPNLKKSFQSD